MKYLHALLLRHNRAYAKWHDKPYSTFVHVAVSVVVIATTVFSLSIYANDIAIDASDFTAAPNNSRTVPSTPSGLVATAVSASQINIRWSDNSTNETGFTIQRSTSQGGVWQSMANVGANITSYSNTGLNSASTYYYRVAAYNTRGTSKYSNTASVTTFASDACSYSILPNSASYTASGGTGTIQVTTPLGCSWLATTMDAWISAQPTSGVGAGTVNYSIGANTGSSSRTGNIVIGGRTLTITQAGAVGSPVCNESPVTYGTVIDGVLSNGDCTSIPKGASYYADRFTFSAIGGQKIQFEIPYLGVQPVLYMKAPGATSFTQVAVSSGPNQYGGYITKSYEMTLNSGTYTIEVTSASVATNVGYRLAVVNPTGCFYMPFPWTVTMSSAQGSKTFGIEEINRKTTCPWQAQSQDSWVTINTNAQGAGATFGYATISYSVTRNTSTSPRTGRINIGTASFIVTQDAADTVPPSIPVNISAFPISAYNNHITWSAVNDTGGSGVAGYKIYRDGVLAGNTTINLRFPDTKLQPNTRYCYSVTGYDNQGNESAPSSPVCATTKAVTSAPLAAMRGLLNPWKTLGVRFNFRNYTAKTVPDDFLVSNFFNSDIPATFGRGNLSRNTMLRDYSYGQWGFDSDYISEYITLPIDASCKSDEVFWALSKELMSRGIDIFNYDALAAYASYPNVNLDCTKWLKPTGWSVDGRKHVNFAVIPPSEGLGIGLNTEWTWEVGDGAGHNYGHNPIGYGESVGFWCGPGIILAADTSKCITKNYHDSHDAMGVGPDPHFNARSKEAIGWIEVPQIRQDGVYDINPYELPESATKALKVAAGNKKGMYYFEYRRPIGMDTTLANIDGLIVHYADLSFGNHQQGFLLDMTPGLTEDSAFGEMIDPVLRAGRTFTDPWTGFTVSVLDLNDNRIRISIQGLTPGDTIPPMVNITSPSSGETVSGRVVIEANWSDDTFLHHAVLYRDGVPIAESLRNECSSFIHACFTTNKGSFVWDTSKETVGQHTLMVKVYDTQNSTNSQTLTINVVRDTTAPNVILLEPAEGATIGIAGLDIKMDPGQDKDLVLRQVLVDGVVAAFVRDQIWFSGSGLQSRAYVVWQHPNPAMSCSVATSYITNPGEFEHPPSSCHWNTTNVSSGQHTITLRAYDNSDNVFTKTVTVVKP